MTSGLRREGIATTQLVFIDKMDKKTVQIDVAAVHDDDPSVINDFRSIGCKVITFPDRKNQTTKYIFRLIYILKREKYDIIHVHGSSAVLGIEMLIARIAGVPVRIAHSRNTKCNEEKLDRFMRPLFYRTYTDGLACGIDAGHWLFNDRPFTVVHNGKDFSSFHFSELLRIEEREKLSLGSKIVVGHVGRINQQKNHEFLLRVFAAFHEKITNSVLYLIGDGPLRNHVESLAVSLGILDSIIFAGNVSDISFRLQAMDIMIFPSLYEGLPNVVLEWQAVGLPCLISDNITEECASSDLVHFMSLNEDAKQWADEAIEIYEKQGNREENARRATLALKNAGFDINENANDLVELYKNLSQKRK